MFHETLCADYVRLPLAVAALSLAGIMSGCGSAPPPKTETDLNAAIRRVQVHEAAIEASRCGPRVCEHAEAICREADAFSDADLNARCSLATRACDAHRDAESPCD